MSSREFPVSHEGSTVSLQALCSTDPSASDSPAEVSRSLRRYLVEYCDRYGYRVESSRALLVGPRDAWVSAKVTLVATVEARYDGTWGDVRRVLEEDGQLRPSDRDDAPAGFWGSWDPAPDPWVVIGTVPHGTARIGDTYFDGETMQAYVYGEDGWRKITVPDPETVEFPADPELYWAPDEICATPHMPASDRGWKTVGWVDGPAKAYANGDSITWTSTVTLTTN